MVNSIEPCKPCYPHYVFTYCLEMCFPHTIMCLSHNKVKAISKITRAMILKHFEKYLTVLNHFKPLTEYGLEWNIDKHPITVKKVSHKTFSSWLRPLCFLVASFSSSVSL